MGPGRLTAFAVLLASSLPVVTDGKGSTAAHVRAPAAGVMESRAVSTAEVCIRWAHQSALVNGTVYMYGGEAKATGDQSTDTWNNKLVSLDLTRSWPVQSPALTGLPQPTGPPKVAMGYLWNDYDNLYLYGGEFADNPYVEPTAYSTWQYKIATASWTEYKDPVTSAGNGSEPAGLPIQRAAEGAGISVPELGLSWYFGGHLDLATTPAWSNQVARVYLKSMLEFTHPGYANDLVDSLHSAGAGEGGVYRNITRGGTQQQAGFAERADGVLVYIPGWGLRGVLLGLGGGTVENKDKSETFSSMSSIDVYDIQTGEWYHQATSGTPPGVRVNPCAVVFSALDASSFNLYMYGGQNLLPVAGQRQYTDIWILTVPSFTWLRVDTDDAGEPAGRAGHTCHARDGQMIVIGGYIGQTTECDSPGIYNFNASSLLWQQSFEAGRHPPDLHWDNIILSNSYGYLVPDKVQSVIGGDSLGGATATTPASGPATAGPFKTGSPPRFTVTAAGATATATATATRIASPEGTRPGTSGALVAAIVVAALAVLSALYLGFCAWLYRRQARLYKQHMTVASRHNGANHPLNPTTSAGTASIFLRRKDRRHGRTGSGADHGDAGEHFGWVGKQQPPSTASERRSDGSDSGPWPAEDRTRAWPWLDPARPAATAGAAKSSATRSVASDQSSDDLLNGQEPTFFSVLLAPRRALRVVNGLEEERWP